MLVLLMVLFVLAGLEGMDARWEDPRPDRWRMRGLGMRGFGGVAGSPPSWSRRGGCGLGRKQVPQIALMAGRGPRPPPPGRAAAKPAIRDPATPAAPGSSQPAAQAT